MEICVRCVVEGRCNRVKSRKGKEGEGKTCQAGKSLAHDTHDAQVDFHVPQPQVAVGISANHKPGITGQSVASGDLGFSYAAPLRPFLPRRDLPIWERPTYESQRTRAKLG